jgi:hypothetical protein
MSSDLPVHADYRAYLAPAACAPPAVGVTAPVSRERRVAKYTGIVESRIRNTATTFTTGSWFGRERFWRIQIGRVMSGPAVNVVTIT